MSGSTSTYPIESGIPIDKPNRRNSYDSYPFDRMKVTDSFFVAIGPGGDEGAEKRVRNAAVKFSAKNGVRFTIRRIDGGVRVWRTE